MAGSFKPSPKLYFTNNSTSHLIRNMSSLSLSSDSKLFTIPTTSGGTSRPTVYPIYNSPSRFTPATSRDRTTSCPMANLHSLKPGPIVVNADREVVQADLVTTRHKSGAYSRRSSSVSRACR
ncbi:hypothetical protein K523DRAFT_418632 [Schizophyllum commune Tattone D]|nr:hypothetical protein K523DRAFT_418632 [Schizophyllum commune Tattone D]